MAPMKPWSVRRLTPGERRLVGETFGDVLNLDRVRIWAPAVPGWLKPRVFVPGNLVRPGRELVVWPGAPEDFDAPGVSPELQAVFIHEMTHVWQCQQGVNLLFAKLRAGDRPSSYAYDLPPGCRWEGFNIEQQAMIVQHDFLRRCGGGCPYPAEAYAAVLPFRRGEERPRQA